MPSLSYGVSLGSIAAAVTRTGDQLVDLEITLAAGKAGTLTTRTDNDTGVVTVASGHGITDSDTVDLYWSGGERYGVDVTATTSTTISIDAGAGDNLPSSSTAVVICKRTTINLAVDGDNLAIIGFAVDVAASTGYGTQLRFFDATSCGGSAVGSVMLLLPNQPQIYDITGGASNPLTGNPVLSLGASNGDSTYPAVLKIKGIQDVTP